MNFLHSVSANEIGSVFRIINIPARQHGYKNIQTQILQSNEQFENVFLNANIDYSKENVAILCDVQGSGSNQVIFNKPIFNQYTSTLECSIKVNLAEIGTCDMAYYCFAVAFDKKKVKNVSWNGTQVKYEKKNWDNNDNINYNLFDELTNDSNSCKNNNDHKNDNDHEYWFVKRVLSNLDLSNCFNAFREHEVTDKRLKFLEVDDLSMLFSNNNNCKVGDLVVFRRWFIDYKNELNKGGNVNDNNNDNKNNIDDNDNDNEQIRSIKLSEWEFDKFGNRKHIRQLLWSLDSVIWLLTDINIQSKWPKVNISKILEFKGVRRCYLKAMTIVHPDRSLIRQDSFENQQLCARIFVALTQEWKKYALGESEKKINV